MSMATFSGPVRSGTVRYGAGRNTGVLMLNQSYDSGNLAGTAQGNYDVAAFVLPQGSQIVNILTDQVVAATTGTTTISVGTTSGTVYIRNVVGTGTLGAGRFIVTVVYAQRNSDGSQFPAYNQN